LIRSYLMIWKPALKSGEAISLTGNNQFENWEM
jgi:hypothetical protein